MSFSVTRWLLKTSAVTVRPSPSLVYEKRYRMLKRMTLSNTFNMVNEENRYTSLSILLDRLSGHVGRRQYKLRADLTRLTAPLKELRLDWHDIKALNRNDLQELLSSTADGGLGLNHAERSVLLAATTAKVCGVLRRGVDGRHSESICLNAGRPEHGWRCGVNGHTRDVYFEGKSKMTSLQRVDRKAALPERHEVRNGVAVEVRPAPDFSIVGRLEHEPNPRIWSNPTNAVFDVMIIGFEFRVHPEDARALPQVQEAAAEWRQHAEVVRQVLWEMLELYAVERKPQSMDLQPGELGEPDEVTSYSAAFSRRRRNKIHQTASSAKTSVDSDTSGDVNNDDTIRVEDVVVEPVMEIPAAGHDGKGATSGGRRRGWDQERSWFTPPLPQRFTNGIPDILPFPPTLVVECKYRPLHQSLHKTNAQDATNEEEEDATVTRLLMQPVVEVSCLLHPDSCFWLSAEDEEKVIGHVVNFAKRIPFAVPFSLYLRVDPSKELRGDAGKQFAALRDARMKEKEHWFELERFVDVQLGKHSKQQQKEHPDEEQSRGREGSRDDTSSSTPDDVVHEVFSEDIPAGDYQQHWPPRREDTAKSSGHVRNASPSNHHPSKIEADEDENDPHVAAARRINPHNWE